MLYRIVIEAEGQDPQGLKEDLASALERYGPARVVAVEPKERWRQEGMFDRPPSAGSLRSEVAPAAPDQIRVLPQTPTATAPSRREPRGTAGTGNPWERADKAWDGVMKGLEHG